MKIACIVPGGVDRTGDERVIPALLWLVERLARSHEVHVFALYQGDRAATYQLLGATVHVPGRAGARRRTLMAVRREHRQRPFDLIHAFWATPPGVLAVIAGRLLRRPILLHLGGGELVSLPDIAYGAQQTRRGRLWTRLALHGSTRVTAASGPMLDAAARLGVHADEVPLGVDLTQWPVRAPRARSRDRPARLVQVAGINRVKDQHTLVAAVADLASAGVSFTLDLVGVDTLGGEIQERSRTLGVAGQITFHGFLVQRRLRPLVESADLFLLSSRHEAGPVAVLEAAIAGVPTVGTAVGHVRDWAPEAAVAVPVDDHRALARAVQELLEDEPRRLRVATAAQGRAMARDADWTARRVEEIYHELISGGEQRNAGVD